MVRTGVKFFGLSLALLSVALGACDTVSSPVVQRRAYQVEGMVRSSVPSGAGATIRFTPDRSGSCPASEVHTSSLAHIATVPIQSDGSFSAVVLVDYRLSEQVPSSICTHVSVFLDSLRVEPDSAFSTGPWLLRPVNEVLTSTLVVAF